MSVGMRKPVGIFSAGFSVVEGAAVAAVVTGGAVLLLALSVMPHLGHLPRRFDVTSGCIGHSYVTAATRGAAARRRCATTEVSAPGHSTMNNAATRKNEPLRPRLRLFVIAW